MKVGDQTVHAGQVLVTGASPNVLIGGACAAMAGTLVTCPIQQPTPHGVTTIVAGSQTVLINGRGAARLGDLVAPPCGATLLASVVNVQIGG